MNYFRDDSTLINLGQKIHNSTNKTTVSHKPQKETPTQPTTSRLFLIKNIQTKCSRHQFEKEKQA